MAAAATADSATSASAAKTTMAESADLFIRPYNHATDYDSIVKICEETAHHSLTAARALVPYLYAIPYTLLTPEHIDVLCASTSSSSASSSNNPASGEVVGYIICAPDTRVFVERYDAEYVPSLPPSLPSLAATAAVPSQTAEELLDGARNGKRMLVTRLLERYPAHLHIDVLPGWQGSGWGTRLMEVMLTRLRAEGVPGVHLGMASDNDRAAVFYVRLGFKEVDTWPDGEGGRWFARDLSQREQGDEEEKAKE